MNLNTVTKGIFTLTLAGTLALGIGMCKKSSANTTAGNTVCTADSERTYEDNESHSQDETNPTTLEAIADMLNPNLKHKEKVKAKRGDEIKITLLPGTKTGQTLKIFAETSDPPSNLKEIRLYQDGIMIEKEKEGDSLFIDTVSKEVEHHKPGTHSYFAEVIRKSGEKRVSEIKQVEFTGEILDFPPKHAWISVYQGRFLILDSYDYGDNEGVVHYKVYEDGKLWIDESCEPKSWLFKKISLDLMKTGIHKYKAVFIDQGGNTIAAEATLDYNSGYPKKVVD